MTDGSWEVCNILFETEQGHLIQDYGGQWLVLVRGKDMVCQDLEGPLVPSMKPMIQDLLSELLPLQLWLKTAR